MANYSHNICILKRNLDSLLIEKIQRASNAEGILCAINDGEFSTISDSLKHARINVKNLVRKGNLVVAKKSSIYSPERIASRTIMQGWMKLIGRMEKQSVYDSFLIIGSNQVFFDAKKIKDLMACEKNAPRRLDNLEIEAICTCELDQMRSLSVSQIISLLLAHKCLVYRRGRYEIMSTTNIIKLFSRGVDKVMGQGSGDLLMRTLKLIYKIDEESVVSHPREFESTVKKVLGSQNPKILNEIREGMLSEMRF